MRTVGPRVRNHPTLALLVLVLGLILALSFATSAMAEEPPSNGQALAAPTASVPWLGNGSENNCEFGGTLHWILTPGGTATILSGTLHVEFAGGPPRSFPGYFPSGQGNGAMHFDSVGSTQVVSASATFDYEGTPKDQLLTISHSTSNTTSTSATSTTQGGETTLPSSESTTTSTTSYPLTSTPTPSNIQTGGGGTAGPGAGAWSLAALTAVLGIGLFASALWARHKVR